MVLGTWYGIWYLVIGTWCGTWYLVWFFVLGTWYFALDPVRSPPPRFRHVPLLTLITPLTVPHPTPQSPCVAEPPVLSRAWEHFHADQSAGILCVTMLKAFVCPRSYSNRYIIVNSVVIRFASCGHSICRVSIIWCIFALSACVCRASICWCKSDIMSNVNRP